MIIREYLKEKLPIVILNLLIFMFFALLFYLYKVNIGFILLIFCIWLTPILSILICDLIKRVNYYNVLLDSLKNLDKKYLLSEIINEPDFLDGKILYNILKETDKSFHTELNNYKYKQEEYRNYIESWVHEIKTPISSTSLIIENNKTPITLSILEEVNQIENLVEQALYYSKVNYVEKDYIIKEFSLLSAINEVIKKNSKFFIQRKIKLTIENVNSLVFTDLKWFKFILNQIIINSIKYSKKVNAEIKLYTKVYENQIYLYIEDNGIGISEKDINKVFDLGFTGTNGRIHEKATGMGLYLCKKLCFKLGLNIELNSKLGAYTIVTIIFPKNTFHLLSDV